MTEQTIQSLRDALDTAIELEQFLDGCSLDEYLQSRGLQLQVERLLEILGEALNRVSKSEPDVLQRIDGARNVIGMRNRISHGYDAIDDETVWSSATFDLPLLRISIESLL